MLSWRGYGLLALLPPLLAVLLTSVFVSGGMSEPKYVNAFQALLLAFSILMWFVGRYLNAEADENTDHRFMGFPLEYSGVIYVVLIVLSRFF